MVHCQDAGKICGPDNVLGVWKSTHYHFNESVVYAKYMDPDMKMQFISMEFQL